MSEQRTADGDRSGSMTGMRRLSIAMSVAGIAALLAGGAIAPAAAAPAGAHAISKLGAATPGTLLECESLAGFVYDSTVVTSAQAVPAGALANGGEPIGEHCRVTGRMNERVSDVDGRTYAIGFEMRLPRDWSGRYLYQANGGIDGSVATALGGVGGGESGLQMGMAVLSSDAGHNGGQNPTFGIDPQARLDYGYQAVGTLTPMAKALVEAAYGRGPDRSYMTGGSNGGRHTLVGSARYADQYDGFLAVAPGYNLPKAAVAQIWGAQQYAKVATTADIATAFTPAERATVANAILARCDALDGLADGLVQASDLCQQRFSLERDVPSCSADRDGTCLTSEQKSVVASIFSGATTSSGAAVYSSFPYDAGITQPGWADWEFGASLSRDPGAVGFIFGTPPASPSILADLADWALGLDIDAAAAAIASTSGIYTESAMSFMTPPNPSDLDALRDRGGKVLVVHGTSDAVFSADDSEAWFTALDRRYHGKAEEFARYFEVPGMGHVRGGPATDRYEALQALVDWVEGGDAPDELVATVNPANAELPSGWSKTRSRPLCLYPAVAVYRSGDPESAASFACTVLAGTGAGQGAGNGNGNGGGASARLG